MADGGTSLGAPERKESSRLVLLLSACGSPTDHRSGSGTRVSNICQGMRLGSSANTGCRERRNTTSLTCRPRPTCAPYQPPSRRDEANDEKKKDLVFNFFGARVGKAFPLNALRRMIVYPSRHHRLPPQTARKKKNRRPPASANFARRTSRHPRALRSNTTAAM